MVVLILKQKNIYFRCLWKQSKMLIHDKREKKVFFSVTELHYRH